MGRVFSRFFNSNGRCLIQTCRAVQAFLYNIAKQMLVISKRLVAVNVGISEFDEDGTNVLMFAFD